MQNNDNREKIDRYLRGTASEEEARYVESLFADGESNLELRHYVHKDWEDTALKSHTSDSPQLHTVLDRLHAAIESDQKTPTFWDAATRFYMRAAAILLLPLIAFALYLGISREATSETVSEKTTAALFAPMGSRTSFVLPDGTRGTLNSGSTLSYSIPFSERTVEVTGEAWFEVAHDEIHPFRVTLGECKVEVVGTMFNVNAYPGTDHTEVVLAEGRVNFITPQNEEIPLLPSERLLYKKGTAIKSSVDPEPYYAWTNGTLIFRGEPMSDVVRRLEYWYHVDIRIADKALEEYSFFATFRDDTIDEVLKFLSMTSPMSYRITPPKRMDDGSVRKREVTLYSTRK